MTTEHDEGFAAGIEAAAEAVVAEYLESPPDNESDHAYNIAVDDCLAAIRALKPAPRSAEQEERRGMVEALRVIEAKDTSVNGEYGYFACIARTALNKGAPAKGE